jgi:hypothetical protein
MELIYSKWYAPKKGGSMGLRGRNYTDTDLRTTCRKCGATLKKGDPDKQFKSVRTGELYRRYQGTCKECTKVRAMVLKWSKREPTEIEKQIQKYKEQVAILKMALKAKKK